MNFGMNLFVRVNNVILLYVMIRPMIVYYFTDVTIAVTRHQNGVILWVMDQSR